MKIFTIPNFITLGNLLCGCLGLISIFEGDLKKASIFIFVALLLDFADGFVARLLHSSSEIGKQLDSLADVVSFGVLPSFIVFKNIETFSENEYMKYGAFLLAMFSALRLAKFNIDTRQSDSFIGLPTPANGILIATFPFLIDNSDFWNKTLSNEWFWVSYVLIFSYLLIMELPLFALKFKDYSWAKNKVKFIFLALSAGLLVFFQFAAVPFIIVLYLVFSVLLHFKVLKA